MNLSEAIDFTIEVAESGRPGAAVMILKALNEAVKAGKTDNFFDNFKGKESTLIHIAQQSAFAEENKKKQEQIEKKERERMEAKGVVDEGFDPGSAA